MLDARLLACAGMVQGKNVCDVGTDHALLPVYLAQRGCRVTASDIAEGPLAAARRTIAQHGMSGQITAVLSDGLHKVDPDGLTDIIIAGMGGETIVRILAECPWTLAGISLILQPMTKAEVLRRYLAEQGFAVREECCAREAQRLYAVMRAVYTGERRSPEEAELWLGQMDLSQPDALAYAKAQYERLCRAKDGRIQAGQDADAALQAAEAVRKRLEELT